ncbi:PepSY-associated TM helix domain-containing protein [Derxia gummosa]|uniref:PepSY-associated TM helix domain-containing protein n=1 Tax=Derxia gummosa DSM 723 TaxID=1121388 RepID=A0A8B6X4C3_9BURK|nr:PepSY-associated TM helix domain-containing protein [Derxia gummosa]
MPQADAALRRAAWLKTLLRWHWISSALCLVALLAFSFTGITLNHAASIPARPEVTNLQADLPDALRASLAAHDGEAPGPLPEAVAGWLESRWRVALAGRDAEWSADEVYLPLPRPGGDAWLRIDRETGAAEYERTDRGWISWLNDLHKGRHAGPVWGWFIDLFAVACLVFSITGLLILQAHAARRPSVWPVTGLGLVIPVLLLLLFVH